VNRHFDAALAVFAGTPPGRSRSRFFRDFLAWTMGDVFGVNCRQQGLMKFRALARGVVEVVPVQLGFRGRCTSLLY
jgi:hypothetical protein